MVGRIDSDHMQEHMLQAHVFVLLSDYEGLPISLMEAMACGVVPVCLRIKSGIPELVTDNENGLLVDDRGDGFVAAIRRLRENPELWGRLSHGARAKIMKGYTHEACALEWVNLFRDLKMSAGPRREIRIPRWIWLPPVHPDFVREDSRTPTLVRRVAEKLRHRFGS